MKVVIIEDEQLAAENLQLQLMALDKEITIQAILGTVRDSVEWLSQNTTDLIFMDIHLSDGLSFKIFEQIEVNVPIIFTTAYDQYAIKAFKVNSIDYLLKPIDPGEIKRSLEKYQMLMSRHEESRIDIAKLLKTLNDPKEYRRRFLVHAGQKIKSVRTDDIAYFHSLRKNTFLNTFDNDHYSLDQSLDRIEKLLEPEKFFRVNRRFIINLDAIGNMYILSRSRIKIELKPAPDEEVLVSFHRMAAFRRWLNK